MKNKVSVNQNKISSYTEKLNIQLNFTTLWANSAVDKLMKSFFLFFPENIWYFMQIVSSDKSLLNFYPASPVC